MGYLYKLKPIVVRFIVDNKQKQPNISCRELASKVSAKFGTKLSKSSVNNILKREKLSSSVGRRSKQLVNLMEDVSHGGFCILKGIDCNLNISKAVAEVVMNLMPPTFKVSLKDVEDTLQSLLIFNSIFNLTSDFIDCYNNKEVWALVGRRPSKTAYNLVIKMLIDSQPFVEELVREINERLKPVSGFRFRLIDGSDFFIDAELLAIWPMTVSKRKFLVYYCKANSYVNNFLNNYDSIVSIFNIQGTSIFSKEILNFILSFNSLDGTKQIRQIDLLDPEDKIVETKMVTISEKRFFLLGFWPWQLEIMSEFERRPAKQKLKWSDFGIEYYYQIEELIIPQHLVTQEVKLIAIILKSSPLGAARIGILTNIPKDIIPNYLSYKELYHWISPEERFKYLTKKTKEADSKNLLSAPIFFSLPKPTSNGHYLESIFDTLNQILLNQFQQKFLPEALISWDPLKIKEVFLKQKAKIKRSRNFIIHNIFIDNKLCNESEQKFICQRLNELGIRDNLNRLLWFQMSR